MQVSQGRVHEKLVANFDQCWSVLYRPSSRTLQVRAKADPLSRKMSLRKIRHLLERNLGLQLTESFDDEGHLREPKISGGDAASCGVEAWRTPRTLTTLSWLDGTMGRGYVTVREDAMSEAQRQQANEARKGKTAFWVPGCRLSSGNINEHVHISTYEHIHINIYIYTCFLPLPLHQLDSAP